MTLSSHYLITPSVENETDFLKVLEQTLQAGTRLLQLKAKGLDAEAYETLAKKVIQLAHAEGCKVLLNGEPDRVKRLGADGLHMDSGALKSAISRPLPDNYLVAVSGHDLQALQRGEQLGASFAVLSPVNYTKAHPDIEPLGWQGFAEIVAKVSIPVYALGGVSAEDEAAAIAAGGEGVAGHKGYWRG